MITTQLFARLRNVAAATVLLAFGVTATPAGLQSSASIGRYDFGYLPQGDARVKPLQVFDDGERTYFQFRSDSPVPAIFVGNGREMLMPFRDGPYVVVAARPREFTLALGLARATVVHADVASGAQPRLGDPRGDVLLSPAGILQPARYDAGNATLSSYATPLRGDIIAWKDASQQQDQPVLFLEGSATLSSAVRTAVPRLAKRIGSDAQVTVIGRDDPSMKEDLAQARAAALRKALIAEGIPASNIRMQVGVEVGDPVTSGGKAMYASTIRWTSPAPQDTATETYAHPAGAGAAGLRAEVFASVATVPKFDLKPEDGTIGAAMQRWAKTAGYELVWDAMEVKLTGASTVQATDFLSAVKRVVGDLQRLNYPVTPQLFSDRVVRVYVKN